MKHLVLHQAALGDWVLTFPLLRALEGRVLAATFWSRAKAAAALMDHVEAVDIELREFSRLYMEGGPAVLSPQVESYFDELETVISFVSDGRDHWADNVRRIVPRAEVLFVMPRPPEDWADHVTAWHRKQLKVQGYGLVSEGDGVLAKVNADGPVVVHPGSGGRAKCWPLEHFTSLARSLRAGGHEVVVAVGEVELETWPEDAMGALTEAATAAPCRDLGELMRLLGDARLYVGNDSGPTHLAAQMGVPTVSLFGPTSPAVWSPVGPSVWTIAPDHPSPMTWLSVSRVLEACETAMNEPAKR